MELRDKNGLTEAEFLARYTEKAYPKPSVTADIVVLARCREDVRLLLVRRGGHPYLGCWALPGGFANPNEPLEATAARELAEETGLQGLPLEPVGLFSTPGRDPRGWVLSQAYVSMLSPQRLSEARAGDDAAAAVWFTVRLPQAGCTPDAGADSALQLVGPAGETVSLAYRAARVPGIAGERLVYLPQKAPVGAPRLAFDHDGILLCALQRAGLLP